jgi:hypothetical protein
MAFSKPTALIPKMERRCDYAQNIEGHYRDPQFEFSFVGGLKDAP